MPDMIFRKNATFYGPHFQDSFHSDMCVVQILDSKNLKMITLMFVFRETKQTNKGRKKNAVKQKNI